MCLPGRHRLVECFSQCCVAAYAVSEDSYSQPTSVVQLLVHAVLVQMPPSSVEFTTFTWPGTLKRMRQMLITGGWLLTTAPRHSVVMYLSTELGMYGCAYV